MRISWLIQSDQNHLLSNEFILKSRFCFWILEYFNIQYNVFILSFADRKIKGKKKLTRRRGTSSSSSKERPTTSRWTVLVSKVAKFLIVRPSMVISAVTPVSLIWTYKQNCINNYIERLFWPRIFQTSCRNSVRNQISDQNSNWIYYIGQWIIPT